MVGQREGQMEREVQGRYSRWTEGRADAEAEGGQRERWGRVGWEGQ